MKNNILPANHKKLLFLYIITPELNSNCHKKRTSAFDVIQYKVISAMFFEYDGLYTGNTTSNCFWRGKTNVSLQSPV